MHVVRCHLVQYLSLPVCLEVCYTGLELLISLEGWTLLPMTFGLKIVIIVHLSFSDK